MENIKGIFLCEGQLGMHMDPFGERY